MMAREIFALVVFFQIAIFGQIPKNGSLDGHFFNTFYALTLVNELEMIQDFPGV